MHSATLLYLIHGDNAGSVDTDIHVIKLYGEVGMGVIQIPLIV